MVCVPFSEFCGGPPVRDQEISIRFSFCNSEKKTAEKPFSAAITLRANVFVSDDLRTMANLPLDGVLQHLRKVAAVHTEITEKTKTENWQSPLSFSFVISCLSL
jgi:hypothetical protein